MYVRGIIAREYSLKSASISLLPAMAQDTVTQSNLTAAHRELLRADNYITR